MDMSYLKARSLLRQFPHNKLASLLLDILSHPPHGF
jgi:hypothetical protein